MPQGEWLHCSPDLAWDAQAKFVLYFEKAEALTLNRTEERLKVSSPR
jgi:hypothetical protein